MKAILDEGVPRKLASLLAGAGLKVDQFPKSWKGTRNGKLLMLLRESGYDCLITTDKNMEYQQNLSDSDLRIVVLPVPTLAILERHLHFVIAGINERQVRVVKVLFPSDPQG